MDLVALVRGASLFRGCGEEELGALFLRLNAVGKSFEKGETVIHAGTRSDRLVIVAEGSLHIYEQANDIKPILIRTVGVGMTLGLWKLSNPELGFWPIQIVAAQPSTVVTLDMARLRAMSGDLHNPLVARLAVNASTILSDEVVSTWRKMLVMNMPTLEDRIRLYLAWLNDETGRTGAVVVPFDREKMANYFGVTRPALSRSLGNMRDRGLLSWRKNVFRVNF